MLKRKMRIAERNRQDINFYKKVQLLVYDDDIDTISLSNRVVVLIFFFFFFTGFSAA